MLQTLLKTKTKPKNRQTNNQQQEKKTEWAKSEFNESIKIFSLHFLAISTVEIGHSASLFLH